MTQQTQQAKKAALICQKAQSITSEERQRMIAEAAYRISEQHGFQGDRAMADWLQAEAEVDAQFAEKHWTIC